MNTPPSLTELRQQLDNKSISSVEITQDYLQRIHSHDHNYNSYITVTGEIALQQAKAADKRIAKGDVGPLTGIPYAHKDIFCTQGVKTSCGSKMLDNFIAPYDATVTSKLYEAGAVMLGKTNMDEFAMGSSNENSFYGPTKNPWDKERVPGGSSGGSAACVAAQLAPIATGTDTGGSIRQPAAFCGLTGIKPTYGRVSRFGMVAFASSLDQGGVIAHSAEDAALFLQAMSGHDPKDSTSAPHSLPLFSQALNQSLQGLRIGIIDLPEDSIDTAILSLCQKAKIQLEQLGATISNIKLPHQSLSLSTYYIIAPSEASSNLSRFDGVRFGYRTKETSTLQELYLRSRSEGFGDEVKRRILVGTYSLSAGYYDAYYSQAQKVRRLIKQDYVDAFQQVDILLSPTTPSPAFKIGEKQSSVAMYLSDKFTLGASLAGLPALSLPMGFVEGLPVGLQLIGNYFEEAKLLNVAHQYQQVTPWHQQTPKT